MPEKENRWPRRAKPSRNGSNCSKTTPRPCRQRTYQPTKWTEPPSPPHKPHTSTSRNDRRTMSPATIRACGASKSSTRPRGALQSRPGYNKSIQNCTPEWSASARRGQSSMASPPPQQPRSLLFNCPICPNRCPTRKILLEHLRSETEESHKTLHSVRGVRVSPLPSPPAARSVGLPPRVRGIL